MLQWKPYLKATSGAASPDALHMVFIGLYGYLNVLAGQGNATAQEVVATTADATEMLYEAGARV